MKILRIAFYALGMWALALSVYVAPHLLGFQAHLTDYAELGMEAPLRNVVATSYAYNIVAPVSLLVGLAVAWTKRRRPSVELVWLWAVVSLAVAYAFFDVWFEFNLFEGAVLIGT